MIDESDIVVRGTLADVGVRQWNKTWEIAIATVAVSEVLKGESKLSDSDIVNIEIGEGPPNLAELRLRIPVHDHLWFIKLGGDFPDTYLTSTYLQVSVLRGLDGVVRVIRPEFIANAYSPQQFPVPLDGTDFEQLVEKVRELRGGRSAINDWARRAHDPPEPINRWAAC